MINIGNYCKQYKHYKYIAGEINENNNRNKPKRRDRKNLDYYEFGGSFGLEGERYGTHALRKTWGYQARKKGITIEQISEKLGHRSSIVTKRYIGINQDEINKIEDEVCL